MGFVAPRDDGGGNDGAPRDARTLLPFDGEPSSCRAPGLEGLTFSDAALHTMAFGSTGSGKTTSVVLPALHSLVRENLGGIVIDVKWTLADHVLAIADACGRSGDVVEFGTGVDATPLNVLAGLDRSGVDRLLNSVTGFGTSGRMSGNMDFVLAGLEIGVDLCMLMSALADRDEALEPTLSRLLEMLEDYGICREAAKALEIHVDDGFGTDAEKRLLARIRNNHFHPCNDPGAQAGKTTSEYARQVEWRLHSLRGPLRNMLDAPGVAAGFCDPDGLSLRDACDLALTEGRIVVLRFGGTASEGTRAMARRLLEAWYEAVLKLGRPARDESLPRGFAVVDEFQDVCDLDPVNRLNDAAFLAKAREFGIVFVGATQSASALARGGSGEARWVVESLLNNCNNRIYLYCDDPWTNELARRHSPEVHLAGLAPAEAFVVRFDAATRRHLFGMRGLQTAHDAARAVMANGPCTPEEASPPAASDFADAVHRHLLFATGEMDVFQEYAPAPDEDDAMPAAACDGPRSPREDVASPASATEDGVPPRHRDRP